MATRFIFTPESAHFHSATFPELRLANQRPVLAFDASANEFAYWTAVVPQGWTGTKTAIIYLIMASATTGDTDWDVGVEAITPNSDTVDLDAATSFDTDNSTDNTSVPGTAGHLQAITVTLTNNDSSAAGDYIRFRLTRDAASDTASGDAYVLALEIRDSA